MNKEKQYRWHCNKCKKDVHPMMGIGINKKGKVGIWGKCPTCKTNLVKIRADKLRKS